MIDALVGHLVGDYLLQNDWMAQGKKEHWFPCAIHVLVYATCVMFCSGWIWAEAAPVIWVAVAVPHYLIDRWRFVQWYMRWFGQDIFMEPPMSPWSIIVVDNVFHIVCLWLTSKSVIVVTMIYLWLRA